ncbi:MAG TPA: signal peptide peptidase SppA [Dissulfurispiraceae bacterium]|nr:signal peptide peptidase SppA [Dissulfurispiraceae bacterium]
MNISRAILFGVLFLIFLLFVSVIFTLVSKGAREKVAIVRVEGPIIEAKTVVDEIKGYVKDASVKAIVLRVDSPGGGVVPSQEIYDEIRKAKESKKVVVSMGSVAASGGYYISVPADRIIANQGTITGSIGVIMVVPNLKGLLDKVGIKTEVVKSGKNKDLASVFRGIGESEREIIQGVMDDVHEQFISAVAEGRKMPIDKARKISDGRIFSGRQAVAIGLVDETGDLDDAVKVAAKLGGIEGEPETISKSEKGVISKFLNGDMTEGISHVLPDLHLKYMYYMYMP